jgi:hypothetical protein
MTIRGGVGEVIRTDTSTETGFDAQQAQQVFVMVGDGFPQGVMQHHVLVVLPLIL